MLLRGRDSLAVREVHNTVRVFSVLQITEQQAIKQLSKALPTICFRGRLLQNISALATCFNSKTANTVRITLLPIETNYSLTVGYVCWSSCCKSSHRFAFASDRWRSIVLFVFRHGGEFPASFLNCTADNALTTKVVERLNRRILLYCSVDMRALPTGSLVRGAHHGRWCGAAASATASPSLELLLLYCK